MQRDLYGNPVSTRSRTALDLYNKAAKEIRLYQGDCIATLDAVLEADPDFTAAWAARAAVIGQATDGRFNEELARSLRAGAASAEGATAREQALLGAAGLWARGQWLESALAYARLAQEHPRDLIAVQMAHVSCFFLGLETELRDWPVQALRAFPKGAEGRHAVLGMAAFGYEESGQYDRALAAAEEAVAEEPQDGWAVHAAAHVFEMRGEAERGAHWLESRAGDWAPNNVFAYHNWWHLALFRMDSGDYASALRLYDERIRPEPRDVVLESVDASALLWRLTLEGCDVRERAAALSDFWAQVAQDGVYAFNDWHAALAFLIAGRDDDMRRLEAAMRDAERADDDNALHTRTIGTPIVQALRAFQTGRHKEAAELLIGVRPIAQRGGGSHAQRDILSLTALHAAIRGGMTETAQALSAERLTHKPHSPWAQALARRVRDMEAKHAA